MSHVRYSTADGIASIALARPPLNAFSIAFLDEIIAALRRAGADPDVRTVVLSSDLPAMFCAGLDLDIILGSNEETVRAFLNRLYIELWDVQRTLGKQGLKFRLGTKVTSATASDAGVSLTVEPSAGGTADTETTGRFGYSYFGAKSDWTGFDDGSRDFGPALTDYFKSGAVVNSDIPLGRAVGSELVRFSKATVQRVRDLLGAANLQVLSSQALPARDDVPGFERIPIRTEEIPAVERSARSAIWLKFSAALQSSSSAAVLSRNRRACTAPSP